MYLKCGRKKHVRVYYGRGLARTQVDFFRKVLAHRVSVSQTNTTLPKSIIQVPGRHSVFEMPSSRRESILNFSLFMAIQGSNSQHPGRSIIKPTMRQNTVYMYSYLHIFNKKFNFLDKLTKSNIISRFTPECLVVLPFR